MQHTAISSSTCQCSRSLFAEMQSVDMVVMGRSSWTHLTLKRGQLQLNDLVQHTAGKSCSIHCDNITATGKSESENMKNIYKKAAL